MSKRAPALLLDDMLECIEKINDYLEGFTFEQFLNDNKTIDAVIRNFEIIGEAANRLPDEFKSQFSDIDWQRIRGFRNRIVHDYMGIDFQIVWAVIEKYLPDLKKQLLSAKEARSG